MRRFCRGLYLRRFLESIDTITHNARRNGETESLRGHPLWRERHLCPSDTDQTAGEVHHRPTAVTRINRSISLHEAFVLDVVHCDIALHGAKEASANGGAVADSVAYYH